ncbi:hypothetical protein GALMADRAFT_256894 [Galerina marginata CBS 339.88]|uniref:DUF7918 domain-containing protein n=1 Tax=Galerina marginata (strain CBS 339.88) TaxID=685588 RepID=A0A067SLN0_GALM3|nr:hypothetical protein GALMADRAFT_256894 [Galerina marginata CBS 339.88]
MGHAETPQKTRLEYKKFAAWIEVDGKELACYALDTNKKDNHISCWIASEEGKNFAIYLRKLETKVDCQISAKLDGMKLGNYNCKKEEIETLLYDSIRTSSTTKLLFMFAPLQTTDDDNYADLSNLLSESAKELGEISVKIQRITRFRTVQGIDKESGDVEPRYHVPELLKVHESSKKAAIMPHQIVFGKEQHRIASEMPDETCSVREILATFVFRYRPLDVLRSCGIVLSQPTQPSMEVPRREPSLIEGSSTETPQAGVQVRHEDPDDIRLPEALQPLENSTVSSCAISPPDLENQAEVTPKQEEDKPVISDDDDDDETKALMLRSNEEEMRNAKRRKPLPVKGKG